MIRIGLTGGIGSGKSVVASRWRERGLIVLDADAVSRTLTAPGGEALPEIRAAFGDAVFQADGTLDRKKLAAAVFSDETLRIQLNGIIHPRVISALDAAFECAAEDGTALAAAEVPLLFEAGMADAFDRVVLVAAPLEVRIARIMARDGATRDQAQARIAAQMPQEEKYSLADDIIENGGLLQDALRQADALLDGYRAAWGQAKPFM